MLAASLHGPGGFALAVAAGTAGALTGQICGYAIGRVFGTRLRSTRLGRRIGAERFDRAEDYLRERGASALVAVRFVAVIHAIVPIVAGVARMPFGRFLGWSALGTVLWVGTFAGVGAATASADSTGGVGVVLTAVAATCLGVVPFAVRLFRRSPAVALAGGPVEGSGELGVQALRVGAEQRLGAEEHRPAPARRPARDDRGLPGRLVRPAYAGPGRLPVTGHQWIGGVALLDREAGAGEPDRRVDERVRQRVEADHRSGVGDRDDTVRVTASGQRRRRQQARRRVEGRAGRAPRHHATAAEQVVDRRLAGRRELRVRQPGGDDQGVHAGQVGAGVQQGRGDGAYLEAHLTQREQLVGGDRGGQHRTAERGAGGAVGRGAETYPVTPGQSLGLGPRRGRDHDGARVGAPELDAQVEQRVRGSDVSRIAQLQRQVAALAGGD
ncbi:DedA family protein [Actinoplanes sp. NPDC048791]|uniref:DedA family protein n=1 Tax=Actinoplanes sp. NPDC048791 TaxID=3154623 RepID=UPI0034090B1B